MEENLDSVLIQQLVYYLSKLKLQIKSTPDKILKQGMIVFVNSLVQSNKEF